MNTLVGEIGIVISMATGLALIARIFKQPPLIGYILAGIIVGPLGGHLMDSPEVMKGMEEMGIALLLFLAGLELDLNKAKQQLQTVSILGILQVLGSFFTGLALATVLGYSLIVGTYLGLAISFSSTVLVVKILSESRDLNSLHGRLSVGLLLFQDLLGIVVLTILSSFNHQSSLPLGEVTLLLIAKIIALLAIVWVAAQHVLPPLFAKIARSGELLFLSSLAWCFILILLGSQYDFPLPVGAFLAGISLASLPYTLDILNRLRSLRDFFVILLFVGIGSTLIFPSISYLLLALGIFTLTAVIKPLITLIILGLRGYRNRVSFMVALTQGQISEFSLILAAYGLARNHLSPEIVSSLTFAAVLSLLISTILLTNRSHLYNTLRPFIRLFERGRISQSNLLEDTSDLENHIIIFGYHRMGYHILKKLRSLENKVLVVDFNPDIIRKLKSQKIECIYGDIQDEEVFENLQPQKASLIISTIPHHEETTYLINKVKKLNKDITVIVTAHHIDDALEYYKLGADYVILPHLLGGEHVGDLITQQEKHSLHHFMKHKAEEIKLLRAKNNTLYFD